MIAILAGMLLPALNAARERGKNIRCVSNLKQLNLARVMYSNDYQEWIYPAQGMRSGSASWISTYLTLKYTTTGNFRCPSESKYPTQTAYGMNYTTFGYRWKHDKTTMVKTTRIDRILFNEGKRYNPVLFVDGITNSQQGSGDHVAVRGDYPYFYQLTPNNVYCMSARHAKVTANAILYDGSTMALDKKLGHFSTRGGDMLLYWRPSQQTPDVFKYNFY